MSGAEERVSEIRRQTPGLSNMTYLNSAATGLPPLAVTEPMKRMIDAWSAGGEDHPGWAADLVKFRQLSAALFGAKAEEIAIMANASEGLASLAASMNFDRRRKVVTSALNFPSNAVLWQRMKESGLVEEVSLLKPVGGVMPMQAWEAAIDEETAVVAVDYVSWVNGYREDVRGICELAHRKGAVVVADVYHGAGVFPIDLVSDGVDGAVWGMAKWLCGTHGVGGLYLRQDLIEEMQPKYTGWLGVDDNMMEREERGEDPFVRPIEMEHGHAANRAARYELGTHAAILIRGSIGALQTAAAFDPAFRFSQILKRKEELIEGLEGLGAKVMTPDQENGGSGIVTFAEPRQGETVAELAKRGVIVSGRFGNVRVSPHYYNTGEEVQALLGSLKEIRSKQLRAA